MKTTILVLFLTTLFVINGCMQLTLRPADFSWPVEVVVKPDSAGVVQHTRYQVAFNVKALLYAELNDSMKCSQYSIHMIRDVKGYYFIVAKDFKHVYVFAQKENALVLEQKIYIAETGLVAPAFNQKPPFIQLVNEANENEAPIVLTESGIEKGTSK